AFLAVGPQFFAQPTVVVGDNAVGGFEDGGGGAVILFQANGFGIAKVFSEALDVFNFGTAPTVDGLVVVTYRRYKALFAGQHAQPGVLHAVGILEFVHQNKRKAVAVVLKQVRFVEPEFVGA